MNPVIEEIYRTGVVRNAQGQTAPHDSSSVTFQAGGLLYEFVKKKKPARTIEIGLAYGLSSMFICQAHEENGDGTHTAIDPFQSEHYQSIGLLNLKKAGLDERVRFHEAPSETTLPQLLAEKQTFDFAFIDGSHLFDNAFIDFFYLDKMIGVGGYLAIDDIWMPAVRKVASYIRTNKPYRLVRPPNVQQTPAILKAARYSRRMLQNPIARDWRLKRVPENIALFEKIGQEDRPWDFHHGF